MALQNYENVRISGFRAEERKLGLSNNKQKGFQVMADMLILY
jgi:hypothetical protein